MISIFGNDVFSEDKVVISVNVVVVITSVDIVLISVGILLISFDIVLISFGILLISFDIVLISDGILLFSINIVLISVGKLLFSVGIELISVGIVVISSSIIPVLGISFSSKHFFLSLLYNSYKYLQTIQSLLSFLRHTLQLLSQSSVIFSKLIFKSQ